MNPDSLRPGDDRPLPLACRFANIDPSDLDALVAALTERNSDRIYELGRQINLRGGLPAMQQAYAHISRQLPTAATLALDAEWHGIGAWRSSGTEFRKRR